MFRVAWKKVENKLSDNRKTKVNIRNPLCAIEAGDLPDSVKKSRMITHPASYLSVRCLREFLRYSFSSAGTAGRGRRDN